MINVIVSVSKYCNVENGTWGAMEYKKCVFLFIQWKCNIKDKTTSDLGLLCKHMYYPSAIWASEMDQSTGNGLLNTGWHDSTDWYYTCHTSTRI